MAKKSLPAFMTKDKASVGKEVVAKAKKGKGKKPMAAKAAKGKNPFAKY